jgi:adenylate kinase family enzyme
MRNESGSVNTDVGQRSLVWGNSCSGKSTLASQIARSRGLPFVELDALNWQPNWVGLNATDPNTLLVKFKAATASDAWIVAGSYSREAKLAFWPRLQTIIWLDLPRHLLIRRCLKRSFQRWWHKELLWGTNYESFFSQFALWRGEDSLFWFIWTQHAPKRRRAIRDMTDPQWRHIRWIHLQSEREVQAYLQNFPIPANSGT